MPKSYTPSLKRFNKKFKKVEAEFEAMAKDPARLDQFWDILDINGNNLVSLAEIDKLVVYTYPILNNKKALMRAYKQTCLKDGGDGDAWVEPKELPQLLLNLIYFNKLYAAFISIDKDFDRRLDFNEFKLGAKKLKMKLKTSQARKEFATMDANGGGVVLFDEFCVWYTKKVTPEREIADCTSKFVEKRKHKKSKKSKFSGPTTNL